MPRPERFKMWWRYVTYAISSAAGDYVDAAYKWATQIEEKASFSFEDLFDAGAHPRLDAIIATAALELVKNHPELSREVNLRAQSISKEGKRLRGRQILRIIFEHYELDQSQGFTFSFTDLLAVNLKNDKQILTLQRFHQDWNATLMSLDEPVGEKILRGLYFRQIEQCEFLVAEVAHYNRQSEGHQDKTYAYLHGCVKAFLEREKRKSNRARIEASLQGGRSALPATKEKKEKTHKSKKVKKDKKLTPEEQSIVDKHAVAVEKARATLAPGTKADGECFAYARGLCKLGKSCPWKHPEMFVTDNNR